MPTKTLAFFGCAALIAPCGCGERGLPRSFQDRAAGLSIRYPSGWRTDRRNPTAVTNPAFCLDLTGRAGSARILIRIVEYEPPYLTKDALAATSPRPDHFSLAMLRPSDSDWTPGATLSFRERRRAFIVAVTPKELQGEARSTVEAMLDSIHVGSHGHCRAAAFER